MRVKGYFYHDGDKAIIVDEALKKKIDHAVAHSLPVDSAGRTIYPIFAEPSESDVRAGKTKEPAWYIRPGQAPTLRWYWQIQEHKKGHSGCKPLGDGLCGFKMVRFYNWNETSKKWEIYPMVNHASLEQERVLDSI